MIKIIGLKSGNVYVSGTKEYCFRELNKRFPYEKRKDTVYSEPLLVVKA